MLSSFPCVRREEGVGKGGIRSLTWLGLARMALLPGISQRATRSLCGSRFVQTQWPCHWWWAWPQLHLHPVTEAPERGLALPPFGSFQSSMAPKPQTQRLEASLCPLASPVQRVRRALRTDRARGGYFAYFPRNPRLMLLQ